MKHNRIAFYLPNLDGGGVERAYLELARAFLNYGIQVDFVLGMRSGQYLNEIPDGLRVVELKAKNKLVIIAKLIRYLRTERETLLLTGGDWSNALVILAGLFSRQIHRCVIGQRAMMQPIWEVHKPRTWKLYRLVFKVLYRQASLIICNSQSAQIELLSRLKVDKEKCSVIYNFIDVAYIRSQVKKQPQHPWFLQSEIPVIICVGSLTRIKDQATLVRAFAELIRTHPCYLVLLGEGPERDKLKSLAVALGVEESVSMPGFDTNPYGMIKRAQVLVSSSLTEGCPNIILQALACGSRIVATNCPGGTSELLEQGKWGVLVPVANVKAMAKALADALEGDWALPDGRERAREFDKNTIAMKYLDLIFNNRGDKSGADKSRAE